MAPAELKVLVVAPSIKNWPVLLGAGILVLFTGIVGFVMLIMDFTTAMAVAAAGVALTVWPALAAANTEYWVTNVRVVSRKTLFAASETEIAVQDIRDIKIMRTPVQQALGVGDVEVVGSNGSLRLDGVEDPEEVRDKILTLK